MYRAGKDNLHADALSCQPYLPAPDEGMAHGDVQVCAISTAQSEEGDTIESLLRASPVESR